MPRCAFGFLVVFLLSVSTALSGTCGKSVEIYMRGLKWLSSDFIQKNSDGSVFTGHIFLKKAGKETNVRIDYDEDLLHQRIFIKNDVIYIVDTKTGCEASYSISQTPVYSLFSDEFSLSKEDFSIDNSDENYLKASIRKPSFGGCVSVSLIFSKYKNGNIKYLEGWIVKEPNGNVIMFSFITDGLSINDKSKIPASAFKKQNSPSKKVPSSHR